MLDEAQELNGIAISLFCVQQNDAAIQIDTIPLRLSQGSLPQPRWPRQPAPLVIPPAIVEKAEAETGQGMVVVDDSIIRSR